MKNKIVVKLNSGKNKSFTSKEINDILKVLDKYPEAKEVIINGKTVWRCPKNHKK